MHDDSQLILESLHQRQWLVDSVGFSTARANQIINEGFLDDTIKFLGKKFAIPAVVVMSALGGLPQEAFASPDFQDQAEQAVAQQVDGNQTGQFDPGGDAPFDWDSLDDEEGSDDKPLPASPTDDDFAKQGGIGKDLRSGLDKLKDLQKRGAALEDPGEFGKGAPGEFDDPPRKIR